MYICTMLYTCVGAVPSQLGARATVRREITFQRAYTPWVHLSFIYCIHTSLLFHSLFYCVTGVSVTSSFTVRGGVSGEST